MSIYVYVLMFIRVCVHIIIISTRISILTIVLPIGTIVSMYTIGIPYTVYL